MTAPAIHEGQQTYHDRMLDRVYDVIRDFIRENKYPPTIRDIQHLTPLSSTSQASRWLDLLERKGLVRRPPSLGSKGLVLVPREGEPCPYCGCGKGDV